MTRDEASRAGLDEQVYRAENEVLMEEIIKGKETQRGSGAIDWAGLKKMERDTGLRVNPTKASRRTMSPRHTTPASKPEITTPEVKQVVVEQPKPESPRQVKTKADVKQEPEEIQSKPVTAKPIKKVSRPSLLLLFFCTP